MSNILEYLDQSTTTADLISLSTDYWKANPQMKNDVVLKASSVSLQQPVQVHLLSESGTVQTLTNQRVTSAEPTAIYLDKLAGLEDLEVKIEDGLGHVLTLAVDTYKKDLMLEMSLSTAGTLDVQIVAEGEVLDSASTSEMLVGYEMQMELVDPPIRALMTLARLNLVGYDSHLSTLEVRNSGEFHISEDLLGDIYIIADKISEDGEALLKSLDHLIEALEDKSAEEFDLSDTEVSELFNALEPVVYEWYKNYQVA